MVVYKLIKIEAGLPERSVELTDGELDAIYEAMDDYRHYEGEQEDTALAIQDKISELFAL